MAIESSLLPACAGRARRGAHRWVLLMGALAHFGACAGEKLAGGGATGGGATGGGATGGEAMVFPCCAQAADTQDCTQSKAYQCFCHLVASKLIAAVAEGPFTDDVKQFPDDECLYPWLYFQTIHGDAGATTLTGVFVCPRIEQGQVGGALVPIQADHDPWYSYALPVTPDDRIVLSCGAPVPTLKKDDAIAALLAQTEASQGATACVAYLEALDPAWGETSCSSQ